MQVLGEATEAKRPRRKSDGTLQMASGNDVLFMQTPFGGPYLLSQHARRLSESGNATFPLSGVQRKVQRCNARGVCKKSK